MTTFKTLPEEHKSEMPNSLLLSSVVRWEHQKDFFSWFAMELRAVGFIDFLCCLFKSNYISQWGRHFPEELTTHNDSVFSVSNTDPQRWAFSGHVWAMWVCPWPCLTDLGVNISSQLGQLDPLSWEFGICTREIPSW